MSLATPWTPDRLARLEYLLGRGMTDEEAGARLGVTARAVSDARGSYAVPRRDQLLLTSSGVAAILGCDQRTVVQWAKRGWLPGWRRRGKGPRGQWFFLIEHVQRFLADEAHWHRWRPQDLQHDILRRWAQRLRGHVRFLSVAEVAERMCCSPHTVHWWVQHGRLPGYRGVTLLIREDDLARFTVPQLGPAAGTQRQKEAA